jgi:hypothetical protein
MDGVLHKLTMFLMGNGRLSANLIDGYETMFFISFRVHSSKFRRQLN